MSLRAAFDTVKLAGAGYLHGILVVPALAVGMLGYGLRLSDRETVQNLGWACSDLDEMLSVFERNASSWPTTCGVMTFAGVVYALSPLQLTWKTEKPVTVQAEAQVPVSVKTSADPQGNKQFTLPNGQVLSCRP